MRILVVDDDALLALALSSVVEGMGHQVVGRASTAEEAIETGKCQHPELVLMDVRLGSRTSGIDAAQELRRLGIPSVFVTGSPRDLEQGGWRAGIGVLEKPVNHARLSRMLADVGEKLAQPDIAPRPARTHVPFRRVC